MAYVYADLIRREAINRKTGLPYTIEDVPARLRESVEKILAEE